MSQWASFGTLSEHRRNCVAHRQKCVHSRSLPFCQPRPAGPGYLGCPAEDNQTGVSVFTIKITVPIQVLRNVVIFQGEKPTLSPLSPASPGGP